MNGFETLYIDSHIRAVFKKNPLTIVNNGKANYLYNINSLNKSELIRIYLAPIILPLKSVMRFFIKNPLLRNKIKNLLNILLLKK